MLFLLAVLLAIPTSGLSLLLYLGYVFIRFSLLSAALPRAIRDVAREHSVLPVCFEGLHYVQALLYIEKHGTLTRRSGSYVEFTIQLDGVRYEGSLDREPGGNGSLLCAARTD